MAGGTFDKLVGKVRPGVYVNFENVEQNVLGGSERGTAVIPLLSSTYGPKGVWLEVTGGELDVNYAKFGYSVYEDDANRQMLLIREALKNASTVMVYICSEGTKASVEVISNVLTATAKYGGTRGNAMKVAITANAVAGFDVTVYLGTEVVANYEGLTTVAELIAKECDFITFTGTGSLSAVAAKSLTGGTSTAATSAEVTAFLDALEHVDFQCMALPSTDSSAQAATKTKIAYMRDNMGRGVQAVMPGAHSDYEGIIGVSNSYKIGSDSLSTAEACAWVAGATAGASEMQSNTYMRVDGATEVVGAKTNSEAIAAINAGEFFFSTSEDGAVVVEYDINTLVTYGTMKGKSYSKNRVIRVLDAFQKSLQNNFKPNTFNNSEEGWDAMEGLGKAILALYEGVGAITNVDYDTDFLVDRELSHGDSAYFNVGIQPVDSAEKLYFTVKTR